MSKPFVHTLDEEVRSISGYYVFRKEGLIDYRGQKILFLIGEAQADSACCGHGGCRYALVPGWVRSWKSSQDEEGRPVSLVEPLEDREAKEYVKRKIMETEGVPQVQFG
jgi:hypothetical protein